MRANHTFYMNDRAMADIEVEVQLTFPEVKGSKDGRLDIRWDGNEVAFTSDDIGDIVQLIRLCDVALTHLSGDQLS